MNAALRASAAAQPVTARVATGTRVPSLWWGRRTWVLLIALMGAIISTMDQTNIGVLFAEPQFHRLFALTPVRIGILASSFSILAGICSFVAGPFVDWWRARRSVIAESIAWAVLSAATALATTFPALLWFRALLGAAEGPRVPVNQRFVKEWFPTAERTRANSIWLLGLGGLGPAIGIPAAVFLTRRFGWQAPFLAFGALSLVFLLPLALRFGQNEPVDAHDISAAERDHIAAGLRQEREATADLDWRQAAGVLARTTPYWLLIALTVANSGLSGGLLAWLPLYLVRTRHFSLTQMGFLASLPFLAQVVSILLTGSIEDRLGRRAPVCLVAYVGVAVCFTLALLTRSDLGSAWLIVAATFFLGAGNPTAASIAQTLAPRQIISSAAGITSGVGQLLAAFLPALIGLVAAMTGSISGGLFVLVGGAVLGIATLAAMTAYGC